MSPHRDLAELELTTAQRRLLERLVALVDFVPLVGPDILTGRRLVHLGLAESRSDEVYPTNGYREVRATEAATRWIELHPRRGRPLAKRGGLSERIDVRITRKVADDLDAMALRHLTTRGVLARWILESWVEGERFAGSDS